MSGGARKAPIVYEGEYDATRTYLPVRVVTVTTGGTRVGYLSTATTTGDAPATSPTIWLPLGGGDSTHAGTGAFSIALGYLTIASAGSAIALGPQANATTVGAIAIGDSAQATGAQATAVGYVAQASGFGSTALGEQSNASGVRTTVIGKNAACSTDDRCLIRNNDLELVRSSGSGFGTSIILADSTGARWRMGVDSSGNPIGLGAA